jgi:hypothetical protein
MMHFHLRRSVGGAAVALLSLSGACHESRVSTNRAPESAGSHQLASNGTPVACAGSGGFCFRDTTTSYVFGWEAYVGWWVVFAGSGDSLVVFASADSVGADPSTVGILRTATLTPFIESASIGMRQVPAARVTQTGTWNLNVGIQVEAHPASVPYLMRIVPVEFGHGVFAARLRPTGQRARLVTPADTTGLFALIPNSVAVDLAPKDYAMWEIRPGDHQVLLVADTLYRICRLPCTKLDSVVLTPGSYVVKRF